jgi:hypothetical protein
LKLVSDAAIADKIRQMKQRVRWQDTAMQQRGIDQTRVKFADETSDKTEFSFLVVGDSGTGAHIGYHPQREVAELMLPHHEDCSFMLHTGDVIYLVGSSEYYPQNFILPYKEFLVGGEKAHSITFDNMVFKVPILPVPGNHDYYDLPILISVVSLFTEPIRTLLQSKIDLDIGWRGSSKGNVYARAFLDYLKNINHPNDLAQHLDTHYAAESETGRCLYYQPGHFTRLPNRYYTFRKGGIDFFALDSCTFNDPLPLPKTKQGQNYRQVLIQRRNDLERQKEQILADTATLALKHPQDAEKSDDVKTQVSQLEEIIVDIEKQLAADQQTTIDEEQLAWLKERLIASWQNPDIRGRVLYFHHPPYVTEATKWQQAQTLAVRHHIRQVLDEVAAALGSLPQGRPLVNIVFNGHAHCFEHLQTVDTGHADAGIHWIICGGSGYSLRRQRMEGSELTEVVSHQQQAPYQKPVAKSHLFLGRNGHGSQKKRPYSCLRVDVQDAGHPRFIVRPLVAERYQGKWNHYTLKPIEIDF